MRVDGMQDDVSSAGELLDRYASTRARLMGPVPKPKPVREERKRAPQNLEPKKRPPEPEPGPDWCPEMWGAPKRPLPRALPSDAPLEEKAALVLAHAPLDRTPNLISGLQSVTARVFGVKVRDLVGQRRFRTVCEPRGLAMAIAKELYPSLSLPHIGRRFGGRDHTTVIHAHRKYGPLVRELQGHYPHGE